MEPTSVLVWGGFLLFVVSMLAVDLGLFHRESRPVSTREAAIWTGVWVGLALLFNVGIYFFMGPQPGLEFLTGYLVEYALSVDNIFVFIVLFSYFAVSPIYRHRVLFWGIVGALILRATLILAGAALITKFHWIIYVFGTFLLFTGVRMLFAKEEAPDPARNPVVTGFRRIFPVTEKHHGERFFVRLPGAKFWHTTPLFIVLLVIETTDIMFALDSIPAIFAVTTNSFIVFSSNIFAIMGLRSLYFLLDGVVDLFRYLKVGLALVLGFIGLKMLLTDRYHIPIGLSLGVVASVLVISVLLSVLIPDRAAASPETRKKGRAPR